MAIMRATEGVVISPVTFAKDGKGERDCEGQRARSRGRDRERGGGVQRNNFFNYIPPDR